MIEQINTHHFLCVKIENCLSFTVCISITTKTTMELLAQYLKGAKKPETEQDQVVTVETLLEDLKKAEKGLLEEESEIEQQKLKLGELILKGEEEKVDVATDSPEYIPKHANYTDSLEERYSGNNKVRIMVMKRKAVMDHINNSEARIEILLKFMERTNKRIAESKMKGIRDMQYNLLHGTDERDFDGW